MIAESDGYLERALHIISQLEILETIGRTSNWALHLTPHPSFFSLPFIQYGKWKFKRCFFIHVASAAWPLKFTFTRCILHTMSTSVGITATSCWKRNIRQNIIVCTILDDIEEYWKYNMTVRAHLSSLSLDILTMNIATISNATNRSYNNVVALTEASTS